MAMKSLVLQLKLMALVMVYVEICARGDVSVNCNKATGINMQSHAVARVNQYINCWNLERSRIQSLSSH